MGIIEELKSSKWEIEMDRWFFDGNNWRTQELEWGIEMDRWFFDGNKNLRWNLWFIWFVVSKIVFKSGNTIQRNFLSAFLDDLFFIYFANHSPEIWYCGFIGFYAYDGFSRGFWIPIRWLKHLLVQGPLVFSVPQSRRPGFDMVRTRGILSILRYPLVISYIAMVKPWP